MDVFLLNGPNSPASVTQQIPQAAPNAQVGTSDVNSPKKQIDGCRQSSESGVLWRRHAGGTLTLARQVQDLERQLFQARQQVDQLRAMVSKDSLSIGLPVSSSSQSALDLPPVGLPPRRRPKHPVLHDFDRVRSNLRSYSGSLLKAPAPYRRVGSQQGLPHELPDLPPRQTADRLLDQYFNHIHLQFPILHKPSFYAEYQKVYQEGTISGMRRGWSAVLFCVLACGAMHSLDPNRVQDGKEYLTKGTAMIDFWQDELSVDQAKMAFLTSIFLTEINLKSAAWIWLAGAARVAQDAGLHVETGPWPAVEGEMRRRIWYCIYEFDRFAHPHSQDNAPLTKSIADYSRLSLENLL